MSKLFEQLHSICNKRPLDQEYIEQEYIGNYMVVRWLSFLVTDKETKRTLLKYLGELNTYTFADKYDSYLYLFNTIPHHPYPSFDYLSKKKIEEKYGKSDEATKVQKQKIDKIALFLSESLEISARESKYLIEQGYINIAQLYKIL
tara:strand:- start:16486 stop:16923 length:438 start_codon:yes stop_codon:yes gene_type:complete